MSAIEEMEIRRERARKVMEIEIAHFNAIDNICKSMNRELQIQIEVKFESDDMKGWLSTNPIIIGCTPSQVSSNYRFWCVENGKEIISVKSFGVRLSKIMAIKTKVGRIKGRVVRIYVNI